MENELCLCLNTTGNIQKKNIVSVLKYIKAL